MNTPVEPIVMRRGFRALHRNDGRWQYKIGRQYVILFSPSGKRQTVACQDIAGVGDWERARWKRYDQITPLRINQWLDAT